MAKKKIGKKGKPDPLKKKLTDKQELFCQNYVVLLNKTEAMRQAKYAGSDNTLAAGGYENLRKPHIAARVAELMDAAGVMDEAEILARLDQQAGAEIGMFFNITANGIELDTTAIKRFGHLIKSIRETRDGIHIVMYDSQTALVQLGRARQMWTDTIKHEAGEGFITNLKDQALIDAARNVIDRYGTPDTTSDD